MELAEIRKQIDEIDNQIFYLIVGRIELAKKALEVKGALGKPIYDAERERTIIEDQVKKAEKVGLPTEFITEIYKSIIKGCTQVEEELEELKD